MMLKTSAAGRIKSYNFGNTQQNAYDIVLDIFKFLFYGLYLPCLKEDQIKNWYYIGNSQS